MVHEYLAVPSRSAISGKRMNVLVLNAGSASLKFEVVKTDSENARLDQIQKVLSGAIEGIGIPPDFHCTKMGKLLVRKKLRPPIMGKRPARS